MAPVLIVKVTGNININVELHYRRAKMTDWKQGIPSDSRPVLAVTLSDIAGSLKKSRQIVRAQYIHHKERESESWDDNDGVDHYDDEEGCYYINQGWYELMSYWEEYGYTAIDDPVITWCEMPELPENQENQDGRT
jgi:hypothetical protein